MAALTKRTNIKLLIGYDGTRYLGWQKTKIGPSIEEELEKAIGTATRQQVRLQAASRTDAGVHASGQVVNFCVEGPVIELWKLERSLNGLLPKDIVVKKVEQASDTFHPTLDACSKKYSYHICTGKVQHPHDRFFSWHYPNKLDIELMREAANLIKGKKTFKAFTNKKKNETYQDHTRHVMRIDINPIDSERIAIEITGDNFLYRMVRNIVGTLCYAGSDKLTIEQLEVGIAQENRKLMGITAPACGLTLEEIHYDFQFSGRRMNVLEKEASLVSKEYSVVQRNEPISLFGCRGTIR